MVHIILHTKPYIKAYLDLHMPSGTVNKSTLIGSYLVKLVERKTNQYKTRFARPGYYPVTTRFCLGKGPITRPAIRLNETQTMELNAILQNFIHEQIRSLIYTYMEFDNRLNKAILFARQRTGMTDDELLTDDAIIKYFQRYRAKHGGPRVYQAPVKKALKVSDSNHCTCTSSPHTSKTHTEVTSAA